MSSNWAGYVAQPALASHARFTGVSGTWTVPSVTCPKEHISYSAVWVGLGGYREAASSLEQVGVDANCSRGGHATYASWFELLPAPPIALRLKVKPGDLLSASVTARGRVVTLRLRDLTTSTRFSTTRRLARIDLTSAEWIVEAPSECSSAESCTTLSLSNFGEVAFASTSATAHGHSGPLSDAQWSLTALELHQRAGMPAHDGASSSAEEVLAAPTSPGQSDGSFVVGWHEQSSQEDPTAVALPSGSGGTR